MSLHILIGKVLYGYSLVEDGERIIFHTDSGDIMAVAQGDCCSHSWVENVEAPALGFPCTVLSVESLDMPDRGQPDPEGYEYIQYYGLRIVTNHGDMDIDYRNSSNGYYGGSLEFPEG